MNYQNHLGIVALSAVFGPAGLVDSVSGVTVIIARWGAPPRSVDRSWLSYFVFQYILQVSRVALESVFLSCQDFSPSICVQVLISLELLLLLFQAPRSGHKPTLEALLLYRILRHAELVVAKANLVFGGRHVAVLLRVSVHLLFAWADLLIFLLGLLKGWLIRVVFLFGTIRIVFVSWAGIAVAGLGTASTTPMLCFSP